MVDLQQKDINILKRLVVDGREKVSVIAKKTRLSQEIVGYRINKMVRDGVIKRFGTFVDETKFGYHIAHVYFHILVESNEEEKQIVHHMIHCPNTVWFVRCGGKYNFCLELFAKNVSELDIIVSLLSMKIGKGLMSLKTHVVSYQYKYTYGIGPFSSETPAIGSLNEIEYVSHHVSIKEKERRLLTELENDGRASLVDLSKKIKSDPDTISYHIRELRKKGILLGITPFLDLNMLGFGEYIVIVSLQNVQMTTNPLIDFVQQQKWIRYCVRHMGTMQLHMLVCTQSLEHFHQILDQMQYAHKNIILSVEFYPIFKHYYESLFPPILRENK